MPDHFYVYPSYLRSKGTRADGRRVPATVALNEVTADEILSAVRRLGYTAEAESGKQYPRESHRFEGRIKVTKKGKTSKTELLRKIAELLRTDAQKREAA